MAKQIDLTYITPCVDPEKDSSPDARRKVIADFIKKAPIATKSDIVAFLSLHYPDISGGGHRGLVQREYADNPPWDNTFKQCPKCDTNAKGNEDIQVVFGTRKSGGKIISQSWCRSCR